MTPLKPQLGLTEQVYRALADEIADGRLAPGMPLRQEQIAADLGVSRQPVQQALALLKADGILHEHGKRGLVVRALDPATLRQHYEIRAALDGLAVRLAAERVRSSRDVAAAIERDGGALLQAGRAAIDVAPVGVLVQHDIAFHAFFYQQSGNGLIEPTAALHWRQLRRVMGEVLRHAGPPDDIWREHGEILEAVVAGDAVRAEALAIAHVGEASARLQAALARNSGADAVLPRSTDQQRT